MEMDTLSSLDMARSMLKQTSMLNSFQREADSTKADTTVA